MYKLALRYIFRQKVRTGLILCTIMLGVASLIFTGGFIEGIFVNLREATIHSQLGHIQVYRAGYSTIGRRDPYHYLIPDSGSMADQLAGLPHVTNVSVRLNFSGLANNGRADLPIIGEGIEPRKEAHLGSALSILTGRRLANDDRYGILLGQGVSQSLQVAPGDSLTLLTSTPDGALNSLEFEVLGVFQSISRDYDNRAVQIHLEAAQELLDTDGVHSMVFLLDDTNLTDEVAKSLEKQLDGGEFEVKKWNQLADFYAKTVDLYQRQFGVMNLIILIMVILSVTNSINMAVNERRGEFGTQMALGLRGGVIFRQVITENTLLGALGATAGVALGAVLSWAISGIGIEMPPLPNSSVSYTARVYLVPDVMMWSFGIGAAAALISSIAPAYRVSRLPVAEALRENM